MKKVTIEDNKNNIVKKHNDLIHKARYSLSENGIKIVSTLISMIRKDDEDFQEYHFNINDFKELINSNSKEVAKYVDIMTDELMSKPFKIDGYKFNWCYLAHYKEGDNTVMFKIAPELKPYLLELQKNFTQYNINDILLLKSAYVIRFYELCIAEYTQYMNYNKNAKSYTFELDIQEIRELFEIPDSFKYNDIKRHIIDKAVKQFKEKTNIQISYKEQKLGKKVVRLQITIKDNFKGSNDYMRDLKSFISHMRKNFTNQDIYKGQNMVISIDENGRLYNKKTLKEYDKSTAQTAWETLYKAAQENKLLCLKQGTFDMW